MLKKSLVLVAFGFATTGYSFSINVCKKDFEALCKDMEFNKPNITKCLKNQTGKLTGQCKQYVQTANSIGGYKNPLVEDKKDKK